MKRHIILALLTVSFLIVSHISTYSETYTYKEAKLKIDFPDGWTAEVEDGELLASPPDAEFVLVFSILKSQELESSLNEVERTLSNEYENAAIDETQDTTINGMNGITGEGTAADDEEELFFTFLILKTKSNAILFMVGINSSEVLDNYEKDIETIIKSIKPSK